jgi:hypothetical protein
LIDELVALLLEWGPESLRPFPERARERWPAVTDEELAEAKRVHDRLLSRACNDRDADLAAEFPQLSRETVQHAGWQGQYSRWRDGEEP